MESIKEAYKHTMDVIESLKKQGLEVIMQKPKVIKQQKTINELNELHWSDWRKVQFKVNNQEEAEKVSFARRYLGVNGVYFDTGSSFGSMDWEIDWSFLFTGSEEDKEIVDFDKEMENFCLGSRFNAR